MYPKIEKFLANPNQARLLQLHRSFRSSFGLFILFAALTGLLIYLTSTVMTASNYDSTTEWISHIRWFGIIPFFVLLEIVRRYFNDLYVIGRDRITHYQGRLSLRFSIPAVRCVDLRAILVEQGIIGRIFNFGDLHVCTAAQDEAEIIIKGVLAPQELAKLIHELREISQQALKDEGNHDTLNYGPGRGE